HRGARGEGHRWRLRDGVAAAARKIRGRHDAARDQLDHRPLALRRHRADADFGRARPAAAARDFGGGRELLNDLSASLRAKRSNHVSLAHAQAARLLRRAFALLAMTKEITLA